MTTLSGPIRPKRSTVTGETPAGVDLVNGEIAVNTADGKLFVKHSDGSVKEISGTGGGGGGGGGVGTTYIFNQYVAGGDPTANQGQWSYPTESLDANNTAILRLNDFDAGGNDFRQAVADNGGNETLGASFYISIDGTNWAQVIASDQNEESVETGLRLLNPDWIFTNYTETLQSLTDGVILPNASTIQIRFETPVVSDVQLVNEQKGIVKLGLGDMVDTDVPVKTGTYAGPDQGQIPTAAGQFWAPDDATGNQFLYFYRQDNEGNNWASQLTTIDGQQNGRAAYTLEGGPLIFFEFTSAASVPSGARFVIPSENRQKIRTDLTSASEIRFYWYSITSGHGLAWDKSTSTFTNKLIPDNTSQLTNGANFATVSQLPTRLDELDLTGTPKTDDILQWNSSLFKWEPRSFSSTTSIVRFTPGTLSQSNMRGSLTAYADEASMVVDGWTSIPGFATVDDTSIPITLSAAQKSILEGAVFIPSSNIAFDPGIHDFFVNTNGSFGFNQGPGTNTRSGNLYTDGASIDFYCCFKSADLKGKLAGYRIVSDSSGEYAISFRFEYLDPYNQALKFWPVEVDLYANGRIDVRYGTPTDPGMLPTVPVTGTTICGITSRGAAPGGLPDGMSGGFPELTDSGEYSCIISSNQVNRTNLSIKLEDLADVNIQPDVAVYDRRTSTASQDQFGEWNYTSGQLRLNQQDYGNESSDWLQNLVGNPVSTRLHIEPENLPDFYIQATVTEGTTGSPQYWLPVTSGGDGFLTVPVGTLIVISTVVIADGSTIVWDEATDSWISASGSGGAVSSVNEQTGAVSLGVADLDDTGFGSYVAPSSGQSLPSTGVSWSDPAGGGGRWTLSDIRINRNDGSGGYDGTDYAFLQGQEVRVYQTDVNGVPNGTTWTVTVSAVIGGEEYGGWYGIEYGNQGAAPTGSYYFRLGLGILPVDGSVLSYNAATERWVSVVQGSGQVASVNGETGVVSLGIQDMDDFELNQTDLGTQGGSRVRTSEGQNQGDQGKTVIAGVLRHVVSHVNADGINEYENGGWLGLIAPGDTLYCKTPDGTVYQTTSITNVTHALGADYGAPSTTINVDNDFFVATLNNIALGEECTYGLNAPLGEPADIALAEGDILQWDNADQKFKPSPQVAIADGSTTGSVLYWNGTVWGESDGIADGNGNINVGGLSDVDLSVAPTDKDSLVYEASSGTWKALNMDPSNPLVVTQEVGSSIVLNGEDHRTIVRASGTGVSADFGTGTDGQYIYLVNNSGADLTLTGSISSADNLTALKSKGTLKAQYLNSTWNLEGDLYSPGGSFSYTLEGATDYTASGTKTDGDLMVWDGSNSYWTSAASSSFVSDYVSSTMKLQDISNVTLTNNLDNQYLVYDATSGSWISEPLDLSGIAEDVQLSTNLDDLANVNTGGKSDGDSLVWDADTASWVVVSGTDLSDKADKNITLRTVVGDYSLIEADNNKIIEATTPSLISLPSTVTDGFQCVIIKTTSGPVQLSGNILSADGATEISTQYGAVTVVHKGSGQWYAFGDLV